MDRLPTERSRPILAVGGSEEDRRDLEVIFRESGWDLHHAPTCDAAVPIIESHSVPVIICEVRLADGCWRDLAARCHEPQRPVMIVASRAADDRLWAEVLNVGGFDVLAKPFDAKEVLRAAELAWKAFSDQPSAVSDQPRRCS